MQCACVANLGAWKCLTWTEAWLGDNIVNRLIWIKTRKLIVVAPLHLPILLLHPPIQILLFHSAQSGAITLESRSYPSWRSMIHPPLTWSSDAWYCISKLLKRKWKNRRLCKGLHSPPRALASLHPRQRNSSGILWNPERRFLLLLHLLLCFYHARICDCIYFCSWEIGFAS